MDSKFSDEQIDRIAKNLLRDFAPDDETLDELADSPRLWWNVRSAIEKEKERRAAGFFARLRLPALAYGALAAVICLGSAALLLNFKNDPYAVVAGQNPVQSESPESAAPTVLPARSPAEKSEISKITPTANGSVKKTPPVKPFKNQNAVNSTKTAQKSPERENSTARREETKTDFIALSYGAETDSGQIVRVKVPSSMMVSLGVKTTVEKESEMVHAEVVIGDDGMARAIRFIR